MSPLSKISYAATSALVSISGAPPSGFVARPPTVGRPSVSAVNTERTSRFTHVTIPAWPLRHTASSPASVMCAERSTAYARVAPARDAIIDKRPLPDPASNTTQRRAPSGPRRARTASAMAAS